MLENLPSKLNKMAKNLVLGLILARWTQIQTTILSPPLPPPPPLSKIWLCHSLDIMVSYYHVTYQKKLMNQSSENVVIGRRTDGWRD